MALEEAVQQYVAFKENTTCIIRNEQGRVTGVYPNKIPGFIIAGQSNAKGRDNSPETTSDYDNPSPQIIQWPAHGDVNQPVIASHPLIHPIKDDNIKGAHIGPGLAFAHELLNAYSFSQTPIFSEIHILPAAVGDESIDPHYNGGLAPESGIYYENMIQQAQRFLDANPNHCIAGILMHQGETDAGHGANYTAVLSNWVQAVRHDLNTPNLPIITGTYTQDWIEDKLDWASLHWWEPTLDMKAGLQHAIKQVSSTISNTYTANLIDLPSLIKRGDQIHFSADSSREHGIRAAHAFLNIVKPQRESYAPTLPPRLIYKKSDDQQTLTGISWTQSDGMPFPDYELTIWDRSTNTVVLEASNITGLSYTLNTPLRLNETEYAFQVSASNTMGHSPRMIHYPDLRPNEDLPPIPGNIEVTLKQNQQVIFDSSTGTPAHIGQDVAQWGSAQQVNIQKRPTQTINGISFNQSQGDYLVLAENNSFQHGNTYIIHFSNIDSSTDNVLFGNSEFVFWYRGEYNLLSAFNAMTGETLIRQEGLVLRNNTDYIFALSIDKDSTSTLYEVDPNSLEIEMLARNQPSTPVTFTTANITLGDYPFNSANAFSGTVKNVYFTNKHYKQRDIEFIISNTAYWGLPRQ